MILSDRFVADIADRFGIGPAAGPLTRELHALITGGPGGLAGFLDRFRRAGFDAAVVSWTRGAEGLPLGAGQVESALGATTVSGLAGRAGLGRQVTGTVLGHAIPPMVKALTLGDGRPAILSAAALGNAASDTIAKGTGLATPGTLAAGTLAARASTGGGPGTRIAAPEAGAIPVGPGGRKEGIGGWGFFLLTSLLGIGVVAWLMQPSGSRQPMTSTQVTAPLPAPTTAPPPAAVAPPPIVPPVAVAPPPVARPVSPPAVVVVPPAVVPTVPSQVLATPPVPRAEMAPSTATPARLTLRNDNGVVTVAGVVGDEATRATVMNHLRAVFGADQVKGDLSVEAARSGGSWLSGLRGALEALRLPGVRATFDGDRLSLENLLPADRDRVLAALRDALGAGTTVSAAAALPNTAAAAVPTASARGDLVAASQSQALSALSALPRNFRSQEILGILNATIINFDTGRFEIPATAEALLRNAATRLKELPPDTRIEIAGYTDNTGDPAYNLQLSLQRAAAVRDFLVKSGLDGAMLTARGYGAANPVAPNDTEEGRFHNRRIEYRPAGP